MAAVDSKLWIMYNEGGSHVSLEMDRVMSKNCLFMNCSIEICFHMHTWPNCKIRTVYIFFSHMHLPTLK